MKEQKDAFERLYKGQVYKRKGSEEEDEESWGQVLDTLGSNLDRCAGDVELPAGDEFEFVPYQKTYPIYHD